MLRSPMQLLHSNLEQGENLFQVGKKPSNKLNFEEGERDFIVIDGFPQHANIRPIVLSLKKRRGNERSENKWQSSYERWQEDH